VGDDFMCIKVLGVEEYKLELCTLLAKVRSTLRFMNIISDIHVYRYDVIGRQFLVENILTFISPAHSVHTYVCKLEPSAYIGSYTNT
jgi:hypothetical protein